MDKMGRRRTPPSDTFANADAGALTREPEKLHPDHRLVKDKIRPQLPVLRDAGFLIDVKRGNWRSC